VNAPLEAAVIEVIDHHTSPFGRVRSFGTVRFV